MYVCVYYMLVYVCMCVCVCVYVCLCMYVGLCVCMHVSDYSYSTFQELPKLLTPYNLLAGRRVRFSTAQTPAVLAIIILQVLLRRPSGLSAETSRGQDDL